MFSYAIQYTVAFEQETLAANVCQEHMKTDQLRASSQTEKMQNRESTFFSRSKRFTINIISENEVVNKLVVELREN